ncbi:hypothetical protein ACLOJK_012732 [Asimina triloba]
MAFCYQSQLLGPTLPPRRNPTPRRKLAAAPTPALSLSSPKPSKPHSPKIPNPSSPKNSVLSLSKSLAISSATALVFHLSFSNGNGDGFFGGGGKGGGDGGGGNFWSNFFSGGNFWSKFFSPLAFAKDEGGDSKQEWDPHGLPANFVLQINKLSSFKRYRVSEVLFFDQRRRSTVKADDSFFEMVSLRPGGIYTKATLETELETLSNCGMFEKVGIEAKTNPDGSIAVTIAFTEATWTSANSFRCINVGLMPQTKPIEPDADMTEKEKVEFFRLQEREYRRRIERSRPCLLPDEVEDEISMTLEEHGRVTARLLQKIRDRVQKWYHDEGYACAQVVNFGNLNTREIVCEVVEGDITQLDVQFQDKLGNLCEGNTELPVVFRELPKQLWRGHVFNIEAGKLALRNINSLALFSNIEVNPRPDEKNDGGIIVEIKLKELEQKSAEVSTEWSIVPGRQGRPTLASIQPGGTVSFEHRNLKGLNRSILGSVTSSNLLNPQDDLSFKLEYVHPYIDGLNDPRNRIFRASCFNSRKLSPVFTGGPGVDEVPAIWVDRVGFKANIAEASDTFISFLFNLPVPLLYKGQSFTRQSKLTYGIVMEEITTRDETSSICTNGSRALPSGALTMDGPPTTLSGTGIDRMAFAQANITRDNTKFVNGTIVGERNVFQLDQGLGIGSSFPFFNRHQLTLTRFIPVATVEEGAGKPPPPVLVLHGHYGGCVGDLPSYDAFTLGGPYSVRGYNMGELGACRNILEVAAELRIPVRNTHVYVFAEHGNDLGSSKDVKGNPTEFFRRVGHGSSYGAGVKLGLVRAEYAKISAIAVRSLNSCRAFWSRTQPYAAYLQTCASDRPLEPGRKLHAQIPVNGVNRSTRISTKLIDLYMRWGQLLTARQLFDEMGDTNPSRWVILIMAFARHGYHGEALELFCQMRRQGLERNEYVLTSVIKACTNRSDLRTGEQIHSIVLRSSLDSDTFVATALTHCYARCGRIADACRAFIGMLDKDVVAWNAVVSGHAHHGLSRIALGLFEKMRFLGLRPDLVTWNAVISGFALAGEPLASVKVFEMMSESGIEPDVVSWTSVISGFVQNFCNKEAFGMFRQMMFSRVRPSSVTVSGLLPACANVADLRRGKQLHGYAVAIGVEEDIFVCNALVDMYAKCGFIFEAAKLFHKMKVRNTVSWNSMIFGYANHGYCTEALELFNLMLQMNNAKPDHLTFTAVLTACCHAGMVDVGHNLFYLMREEYGIKARLEHYACIVDLLGRAGKVREAYDQIRAMPIEPDFFVWGALLGACRIHGNIELAEVAASHLFELEPWSAGSCVLLSNLLADDGRWEDAAGLKKIVKRRKLRRIVGCSWMEAAR